MELQLSIWNLWFDLSIGIEPGPPRQGADALPRLGNTKKQKVFYQHLAW